MGRFPWQPLFYGRGQDAFLCPVLTVMGGGRDYYLEVKRKGCVMYRTIIIEDDPMVASINRQYLQSDSRFVLDAIFGNGGEAIEYMEGNKVDLAIVDYYMPLMNGMEFIQTCHMKGFSVAMIMITAASSAGEIAELFSLVILDYIVKPFTFERFRESLNKFIMVQELRSSDSRLSQEEIDSLIAGRIPSLTTVHNMDKAQVKGIQAQTLELLRDHLRAHKEIFLSSDDISKEVSLSRITIRRYLNYLLEMGEIQSMVDYSTGGRPSIRYRLI